MARITAYKTAIRMRDSAYANLRRNGACIDADKRFQKAVRVAERARKTMLSKKDGAQ
jgi:hypothetical protein